MKLFRWSCTMLLLVAGRLYAQEPQFIVHDVGEANATNTILSMC